MQLQFKHETRQQTAMGSSLHELRLLISICLSCDLFLLGAVISKLLQQSFSGVTLDYLQDHQSQCTTDHFTTSATEGGLVFTFGWKHLLLLIGSRVSK